LKNPDSQRVKPSRMAVRWMCQKAPSAPTA
jgi:hypothetical protein